MSQHIQGFLLNYSDIKSSNILWARALGPHPPCNHSPFFFSQESIKKDGEDNTVIPNPDSDEDSPYQNGAYMSPRQILQSYGSAILQFQENISSASDEEKPFDSRKIKDSNSMLSSRFDFNSNRKDYMTMVDQNIVYPRVHNESDNRPQAPPQAKPFPTVQNLSFEESNDIEPEAGLFTHVGGGGAEKLRRIKRDN